MKKLLTIEVFCLLVFIQYLSGQATIFQKVTANNIQSANICETNPAGYVIFSSYGSNGDKLLLAKMDENGNLQFRKTFDLPGVNVAMDIRQTSDSGFILLSINDNPTSTQATSVVIRTNALGDALWTRVFGISPDSDVNLVSIYETSGGDFVAFGAAHVQTQKNIMFLKLNASGDTLLTRRLSNSVGGSINGYGCLAYDGNFLVTGTDQSIVKINASGNILWTVPQHYSTGQFIGENFAHDIYSISSGFSSASGTIDIHVLKAGPTGNIKWFKSYGSIDHVADLSYNICADGGFIVGGLSYGLVSSGLPLNFIMKADSAGTVQWVRNIGEDTTSMQASWVQGIIPVSGNDYLFNVYITNSTWDGNRFVKMNGNGQSGCDQFTVNVVPHPTPTLTNGPSVSIISIALEQVSIPITVANDTLFSYSDICVFPDCDPCPVTSTVATNNITASVASLNWSNEFCAICNAIRYKKVGTTTWFTKKVLCGQISKTISNLQSNTQYEWQVRSKCSMVPLSLSAWSASTFFTTLP